MTRQIWLTTVLLPVFLTSTSAALSIPHTVESFATMTRPWRSFGNIQHRWSTRGLVASRMRHKFRFHARSASRLGKEQPQIFSIASYPPVLLCHRFEQGLQAPNQPRILTFHRSHTNQHDDDEERGLNTHHTLETVHQAIQSAVQELSDAHISEPLLSVVHLLSTALKLPWDTGYRDLMDLAGQEVNVNMNSVADGQRLSKRRLTTEEAQAFRTLLNRRLQHEPIQYLCGQWDFLEYTLSVRAPLLCPRPETEELVLLALDEIKEKEMNVPFRILDVGCGTGCIGIALAHKVPNALVTAIDVEPIAVTTSSENAARIGVLSRYDTRLCSVEDFVPTKDDVLYDLVISNPPYIPPHDMNGLQPDVLQYESHRALAGGGPDGMDVIHAIVQKLPLICNSGAVCWMEVDPTQPDILRKWLSLKTDPPSGAVRYVCSKIDMFGKERFVKLQVGGSELARKNPVL